MKKLFFCLLFIFCYSSYGQVVINELDADTPSTDVLEFVELKSVTPNFSLNGYVLVFFNASSTGTSSLSYFAFDLDGYTTDINGIIHFGNTQVSPSPTGIFTNATIQNGPDFVALYQANATDFPINTIANATGYIDGIAYSNGATVTPSTLMTIFGVTVSTNENQTLQAATKSIQRNNDGTYSVATPTPGVNNDGTGIVLNAISITPSELEVTEGQTITINFSTTTPVVGSNLIINFSLNKTPFLLSDFSGSLTTFIPVGQSSVDRTFLIVDDAINEGDEEMLIRVNGLQTGFTLVTNNIFIRVHDNDFIVQPWGTPLNPSYGNVTPTIPVNYYSSLEGLSGANLKQALQDIIANPNVIHAHNYGDVETILKTADQNPLNSGQVWLMYVEEARSKIDFQDSSSNIGVWNREHIWPQSRGGFQDGTNSIPDGINTWLPSSANDILAGHADAHHLRAEDGAENSLRNNRDYGSDYNGPTGNSGSWRGDVARSLFYMAVRYNGLNLVNGNPSDAIVGQIGDLASLLEWNASDPKDDFEMNRNNYIYTWQLNRNPFIDYPNLANYIFGTNVGQPWFSTLSNTSFTDSKILIYPNPTNDRFTISGLDNDATIRIYNNLGVLVFESEFKGISEFKVDLPSGIYLAKIASEDKMTTKKITFR